MAKPNERKPKKPGPKPTIVAADGDWTNAIGQALKAEKPAEGWPDHGPKKKGRKDSKPSK